MMVVDWQLNFGLIKLIEVVSAEIAVYLYLSNQSRDQVLNCFKKN